MIEMIADARMMGKTRTFKRGRDAQYVRDTPRQLRQPLPLYRLFAFVVGFGLQ